MAEPVEAKTDNFKILRYFGHTGPLERGLKCFRWSVVSGLGLMVSVNELLDLANGLAATAPSGQSSLAHMGDAALGALPYPARTDPLYSDDCLTLWCSQTVLYPASLPSGWNYCSVC